MRKTLFLVVVFVLVFQVSGWAKTIVTHETEKYFYKNGQMSKFEGQFEHTYYLDLEKNTMERIRVYDYQTKKITPDNTRYRVEQQLLSHPTNSGRYSLAPIIRAVGQTGPDAMELLVIKENEVDSFLSTTDELIVSHSTILKNDAIS